MAASQVGFRGPSAVRSDATRPNQDKFDTQYSRLFHNTHHRDPNGMDALNHLKSQWDHLYRIHLPALAKAQDPVQKHWPVTLDHCFARVILDNTIGIDKPWHECIKRPAVENMTLEQLRAVVQLGEQVATGEVELESLNLRSLQLRGKKRKASAVSGEQRSPKQSKADNDQTISKFFRSSSKSRDDRRNSEYASDKVTNTKHEDDIDIQVQLKRIANSDITAFRKQALSLLCQVPRGRYSTYQAISDHITKTSHKMCARAVGSAIRNNPFAPEVPCHRILANDGSLGGFKGFWGEEGKFATKKHELLYEEGVRFSSNGKAKGLPFKGFTG